MGKQFEDVDCRRGAPMGRTRYQDGPGPYYAECFKVRFVDGDYDDGGAYWGGGQPLYCVRDKGLLLDFTRADGLREARRHFEREYPAIRWKRK